MLKESLARKDFSKDVLNIKNEKYYLGLLKKYGYDFTIFYVETTYGVFYWSSDHTQILKITKNAREAAFCNKIKKKKIYGVVDVLDVFKKDEYYFIIMKFIKKDRVMAGLLDNLFKIKVFSHYEFLEIFEKECDAKDLETISKDRRVEVGHLIRVIFAENFAFYNITGYNNIDNLDSMLRKVNKENLYKALYKTLTKYYAPFADLLYKLKLARDSLKKIGIQHLDVSPRNIVYSLDDGQLYLIDFGIASGRGNNKISTLI